MHVRLWPIGLPYYTVNSEGYVSVTVRSLQNDHTRRQENFHTVDLDPCAGEKNFVTRVLKRDLFAIANLLVFDWLVR